MTSPLSDDERAQLSVRADEFHAALVRGAGSNWEPFLSGLQEQARVAVLTELVIIDLIYRWERKERPEIEEYVARFPELGPMDRVPSAVIIEEYRCRRKAGERYDVARYKSRFPIQFPLIQSQLESAEEPAAGTVPASVTGTLVGVTRIPTAARTHSPGSVAEEYEFVRVLGRGVFGEVWLAKKRTSGIEKAIKIVTQPPEKDATKRERRSLELIKNLRHPYLLCTEDFWVADHRLHIVMELAECTLRNRLEACRENGHPGIPEGELLGYIREAAEGLDFLHSRHVVHRDVKPDNILILNGHAKVADFGLALHQEKLLAPMQTFAGTPAYMAPEVWGKEGGPASDLYSLAVTYAELRQGHPPLKSQQIQEMMFAHLDGSHDFEAPIRDEERQVLTKALARLPEERYPSCMAFVESLSVALGVSIVPRSGVFSEPRSRVIPSSGSESRKMDSQPPPPSIHEPRGSVASDSESRHPTETRIGKSTVTDSAKRTPVVPAIASRNQPRLGLKTVLAGLLTLGLIGVFGVAVWALFGNGGESHSNSTAGDTSNSNPSSNGGSQPTSPTAKTTEPTTIPDQPITPILPARAMRDPKGRIEVLSDGRQVYDWIVSTVGEESVRFRLIAGGQGPRPIPSFYMMESKVWNNLFRAGKLTPPVASEINGPDAPVTSATVEEAMAFARDVFGGKLPSPDEWDLAAGLYAGVGRDEVTRADGRPRVMLPRPEPTHGMNAGTDINHFGLRDMAGNGREWTRMILMGAGEREIGSAPLTAMDRIILRGRNYTLSRGLTFDTLKYEQTTPQTQFATARSPYTSFRVAVPLP
ncbi:MAG TPA: bifunctional serine/threonine-protein kinase/formylglycine-generating enzyme family protein [Gemmata sp.]|jgi:serine/threonine protein kinase|nr:bifunctional serine/threonine-protein kinase/formylglycine-generating enzyme family protein [Gemmata sp.]